MRENVCSYVSENVRNDVSENESVQIRYSGFEMCSPPTGSLANRRKADAKHRTQLAFGVSLARQFLIGRSLRKKSRLAGAVRDHGALVAGAARNLGFAGERGRRLFWTKGIDRGLTALTGHRAFLICGAGTADPPHLHRRGTWLGRTARRSGFSAQPLQSLRPRRAGFATLPFRPLCPGRTLRTNRALRS